MTIEELKETGVFLHFHVRKGLEVVDGVDCASLRSMSLDTMVSNNRPLILTVEGEKGCMILDHRNFADIVLSKVHVNTKRNTYKYTVHKFKWMPLDNIEALFLHSYYEMIKKFNGKTLRKLNKHYGIEN